MGALGKFLGIGSAPAATTTQSSGTRNPEGWLIDLFGGMLTSSGIRVDPYLAMTVPGFAACVHVLSDDLSKVPLVLYRRNAKGEVSEATDHPLYRLLRYRPTPWMHTSQFRRSLVECSITRGNGYARVLRDGLGEVRRLNLVKPGYATPRWTLDGEPVFDIMGSTDKSTVSYQDCIHVPYRASGEAGEHGGVAGISPVQRHPEAIALAVAAERFAGAFFRNGARPSVVLETDKKFADDAVASRTRAQFEEKYSGVNNAFRVAILELGMKLKEFSFNNRDSQLVEVRKDAAVTMCQILNVPPHKVGILDRATNNNIEHQGIDYVAGPVSSIASAIESAIETACLTEREQEEFFVRHDLDELKRGDMLTRYRAYSIGRQWGWLNVDEIRQWEDMNPLPDDQGKTYLSPMNMVPADKLDKIHDEKDGGGNPPNKPVQEDDQSE